MTVILLLGALSLGGGVLYWRREWIVGVLQREVDVRSDNLLTLVLVLGQEDGGSRRHSQQRLYCGSR